MDSKVHNQHDLKGIDEAFDQILRGQVNPCISIEGIGHLRFHPETIVVNDLQEGQYTALRLRSGLNPTNGPCPIQSSQFLFTAPNSKGEFTDYFQHAYPPNNKLTVFKRERDGTMDFMGVNEEYMYQTLQQGGMGFFGMDSDMEMAGFIATRMNHHLDLRRVKTRTEYWQVSESTPTSKLLTAMLGDLDSNKLSRDKDTAEAVINLALFRLSRVLPYQSYEDDGKTWRGLHLNHDIAFRDGKITYSKIGVVWRQPTLD